MTAQVLFLNTFYYPSREEEARLRALQEVLTNAHIELKFATRDLPKFEQYLSKQRYHNGFRSKWRIYPGFKVNFTKLIEFKVETE